MTNQLRFDETISRSIEATYTTPDVVEQRRVVIQTLAPSSGSDVLDIGSGPGFLVAELAEAVGASGSVHGVDSSEHMLALSRRRRRAPGSAPVEFHLSDANALPFPDGSFDLATSTQVYEYVEDMPGALAEAYRVLRPGGRLLVLDTDWDSVVWHSSDDERMRRVLAAWDEHLVDRCLPRRLTRLLVDAGFTVLERTTIPMFNAGFDPSTFSAGLVSFIGTFVPGHRGVTEEEAAAWADDLVGLGEDYFFSLNRYLFLASR